MTRSKRYSSSALAAIIECNEDILIEILLFLPAKPLVKFKAVSKTWRSLISSPCFCRRHTIYHCRRRPETQHSFIFDSGRSTYHVCSPTVPTFIAKFIAVKFDLGFPHVEILQSCNGLFLLRCRRLSSNRKYHYYVFNPTTMQRRNLPPLPCTSVSGTYLIFDPSTSPHYRVLCFEYSKPLVHLYDSEAHEWKLGSKRLSWKSVFHDGIYFNGGIYFLRFSSSACCFTPDGGLTKIPPLPRLRSGRKGIHTHSYHGRKNYAVESNGVLLFFSREETNVLHVYEMKKIETGWTKKYEIDMNPSLDGGFDINRINVLSMVLGEKEEDTSLLFTVPGKLMIYWFHGVVFEVLADDFSAFWREKEACSFRKAHHFIQSLAPV